MLGSCLFLVSSSQVYTFISNHILYLMIIYIDMTHERQRGSYLNFINVVFVVADAIGPLIGASFSEKASWRWLFFFNIPFGPFSALSIYTSCHMSLTPYILSHTHPIFRSSYESTHLQNYLLQTGSDENWSLGNVYSRIFPYTPRCSPELRRSFVRMEF